MAISDARAVFGLSALGTPTGTNLSGSVQIGVPTTSIAFSGADVAYSLRAVLIGIGDELILNTLTGSTSGSTAFVAGTAQVETATCAGTITLTGNASVVVTAAGMTGSPKTIFVAVTSSDTASVWAAKVRTALAADTAVTALFTVSGATDKVILTRSTTYSGIAINAANDATLNIALSNGTCTGITTAATSADTTAGVVTSGAKIYDGDGNDFEGVALVEIAGIQGIHIRCDAGALTYTTTGGEEGGMAGSSGSGFYQSRLIHSNAPDQIATFNGITLAATAALTDITITVIGAST